MPEQRRRIEEKLLDVLHAAILDEAASAARYLNAASLAADPELRELLTRLARDEQEHELILKEQFYAIKKRLGMKVLHDDGEEQPAS